MKITATRIKEIIREEYRRMNEAPLKYREDSPFEYEPIEGLEAERAQAFTGDYDSEFIGVRKTGAGETEYLVILPDGTKDVLTVQVRRGGGGSSEDVDAEIDRRRMNKPMMQERLGTRTVSKTAQAQAARQKGKDIQSGTALSGIDNRERAIMVDLEKIIAAIAEEDDLVKYKAALQGVVDKIRKAAGV